MRRQACSRCSGTGCAPPDHICDSCGGPGFTFEPTHWDRLKAAITQRLLDFYDGISEEDRVDMLNDALKRLPLRELRALAQEWRV